MVDSIVTKYKDIRRAYGSPNLLKVAIVLFLFLVLLKFSTAATLGGNVYDLSLDQLNDVIIKVDTQPEQQLIVKDGTYSFQLPPGDYVVEAKYYEDNILKYEDKQEVEIKEEGEFVYDLILFPSLEEDDKLFEDVNLDVPYDENGNGKLSSSVLVGVLILIIVLIGYFFVWKKKKKLETKKEKEDLVEKEPETTSETKEKTEILKKTAEEPDSTTETSNITTDTDETSDEYYDKILVMLKEHKRLTQKEIRKEIPLSEAKISLIISEMEHKGVVEKIKKGRGNIIVLK